MAHKQVTGSPECGPFIAEEASFGSSVVATFGGTAHVRLCWISEFTAMGIPHSFGRGKADTFETAHQIANALNKYSKMTGERMTKPKLTPDQQRAIDFLPADGNWTSGAGHLGLPLSKIVRLFGDLVESRTDPSIWGRANYRLTPAGVAMFHAPAIEDGT